ncbi:MAG: hypothetical protein RLZZ187_1381 [Pseudomonadota bacterium]
MVHDKASPSCAAGPPQEGEDVPHPRAARALDRAIGTRLRARRKALGLSLDALATQLGISYQQVQKYERGENRIGAGRLPHIARVLGCSVEDLVPSTLVSQTDESSPVSSGVEERGVALQRALAKPEVVRAALLFDAIQAADQRETALAVLEGLGRVPGDAKA